jgi:hypothetical protein
MRLVVALDDDGIVHRTVRGTLRQDTVELRCGGEIAWAAVVPEDQLHEWEDDTEESADRCPDCWAKRDGAWLS